MSWTQSVGDLSAELTSDRIIKWRSFIGRIFFILHDSNKVFLKLLENMI